MRIRSTMPVWVAAAIALPIGGFTAGASLEAVWGAAHALSSAAVTGVQDSSASGVSGSDNAQDGAFAESSSSEAAPSIRIRPAGDVKFRRISFRAGDSEGRIDDGDASVSAGPPETLVYSNTLSSLFISGGFPSFPVADDMRTTSICDCALTTLEFAVGGGGDGTGPGFDVSHTLFTNCPAGGGLPIAGTTGSVGLPDDGDFLVSIDFSSGNVVMDRNIWLRVTPSSESAGTYWGSAAELGYSADYYYNPLGNCFTAIGGGFYASMNARVYCSGDNSAPEPTSPAPGDAAQDLALDTDLSWTVPSARRGQGSYAPRADGSVVVIQPALQDSQAVEEGEQLLGPGSYCSTYEHFLAKNPGARSSAGGCAIEGLCDIPSTRDLFIPDENTIQKTFRIVFHVFCLDNGSNCVATQTAIDNQAVALNQDFEPFKMDFIYETLFHNDTQFRDVISADIDLMKTTYADSPDSKLNIFVANRPDSSASFATFPWSFDALGATGGIMLHSGHVNLQRILGHEVGHCVGLWHTFHGTDEAVGCLDSCYEQAGAPSDTTGDFCSDTNPMPTNNACAEVPGNDPCSGNAWAPTPFRNYMSYTSCRTEWTQQQLGRSQCWSEEVLTPWMELQCEVTYDVLLGTTNPPTTQICSGIEVTTCDPGPLDCDTTYYWQVVSHLLNETTAGPVWSFSTIGGGDCNANSTPDLCEIALGMTPDCQSNGVPDDCDVDPADPDGDGAVSADLDGNGIPDECVPPLQPLAAAAAPFDVRKHRYVSIDATTSGATEVGLKVTLAELRRCSGALERSCTEDNDCDGGASGPCVQHPEVGTEWWVQAPQEEPLGCLPGPCGPTDQFARVDAAFHSQVWTESVLHVGDCEIVPVATYELRSCLPPDGTFCSVPLALGTITQPFISPGFRGNFGDVAGQVIGTEFSAPDGIGNIGDVSAYVLTSQNYGTANTPQTHPTWVDLNGIGAGQPPQYILNVADLGQILKGLQGNKWTDDPGNLNPGSCP